jgi:hypothetical protein
MANYPQLDNASGVWNIKEVYEAVMGGYWPVAGARGIFAAGGAPGNVDTIDYLQPKVIWDLRDLLIELYLVEEKHQRRLTLLIM